MGTVNRITRGLLSLIDAQTQGQNPDEFSREIRPTLDITNMLMSSKGIDVRSEEVVIPIAIGSVYFTDLQVPNGEIWLCRHLACEIENTDPALPMASLGFSVGIFVNGGGVYMPLANQSFAATSLQPKQLRIVQAHYNQPIIFSPGTVFYIQVEGLTGFLGTDPAIRCKALVTALPI